MLQRHIPTSFFYCFCLKYFFCCLSLRKLQSILRSLFRRRYGFIRTQYNRKCNARTFGKFICFFPLQRTVIEYLACLEACNNNILQRKIIEAIISEKIMIKVYTNLTISSWYLKYAVFYRIKLQWNFLYGCITINLIIVIVYLMGFVSLWNIHRVPYEMYICFNNDCDSSTIHFHSPWIWVIFF